MKKELLVLKWSLKKKVKLVIPIIIIFLLATSTLVAGIKAPSKADLLLIIKTDLKNESFKNYDEMIKIAIKIYYYKQNKKVMADELKFSKERNK